MMQEQLRQAGITVDVVGLDPPSMFGRFGQGDYESIYYRLPGELVRSGDEPGLLAQRRLGARLERRAAGAVGEDHRRPDAAAGRRPTLAERQRLFAEVQKVFGENLPAIYFVAPKVSVAMSRRVGGAVPVLLEPEDSLERRHALRHGTLSAPGYLPGRNGRNTDSPPCSCSSSAAPWPPWRSCSP